MISNIAIIRNLDHPKKLQYIQELYKKNRIFFSNQFPAVDNFMNKVDCPYQLEITEKFIDIIDERSGEHAGLSGKLDVFSEMLGDWTGSAWVELINLELEGNVNFPTHFNCVREFNSAFQEKIFDFKAGDNKAKFYLQSIRNKPGIKFSPPVIFLGIFHGLHIDYYLSRSVLANILLVEPEPEKFEVSCYFLDYEEIQKRFGKLLLSIGPNVKTDAIVNFFNFDRVTPQLWTRVLPAYTLKKAQDFIQSFRTQQVSGASLFFPIDIEERGLHNTRNNLARGIPVLDKTTPLSDMSRVVIVASGPSLDSDIKWLQDNGADLIIFAVHSSIPVLRSNGIQPDFQFSIETSPEYEKTCGALIKDIPLIAYCRADTSWSEAVNEILLVSEKSKAQVVEFLFPLRYSHPSTANLALSLACYLKFKTIYLVGCDFGFRDRKRHHAKDSLWEEVMQQEKSSDYVKNTELSGGMPNFSESERIVTQPFLEQARLAAQQLLQSADISSKIYNLSDGVKVDGAIPRRSKDVKIKKYSAKISDLRVVKNAFQPPSENKNFKYYNLSGKELLKKYLENVMVTIHMESFSWQGFVDVLDNKVLDKKLNHFSYSSSDWRMDIYSRLLNDLLKIWYRLMLQCESEDKAEELYFFGLKQFENMFSLLEWPADLDERI